MSDFPYMPLYVRDIFVDTAQLSDAEFTVYHKLLYAMWLHGGSVPDDDHANARLTGRRLDHYRRAKAVLMPMLTRTDDGRLTQKRLQNEYVLCQVRHQKQRAKAEARWNKNKDITDAVAMPRARAVSKPEPYISSSLRSEDKGTAVAAPTPKSELASVLDDLHVKAVIDHRQRLRKPLTAHAAHLLAARLAACPDPNAAADLMVVKGWQSIEASWLEQQQARAPPQQDTMLDAIRRFQEREQASYDGPTIEASDYDGNFHGADQAVFSLAPPKRES